MINALTIDVEDYYHVTAFESVVRFDDWNKYESRVEKNTYFILDLLDEYNTKATFFVLGWVAERNHKLILDIHERGHEIASHGYSHRRIYTQTPEQFRAETRISKNVLEDIIGEPVIGYRAASYSITAKSLWALDILVEEGFRYDSSIYPIRHDLYGIPSHERFSHKIKGNGSNEMSEFPLSTVQVLGYNLPFGGGGYLRLFPYAVTSLSMKFVNAKELQPVVVYFHPWEIDPDQPRIKAPLLSRFRHYTNLRGMDNKIRRLLETFSFASIQEVYAGLLNCENPHTKGA